MQEMKILCNSREHADRVVAAAQQMGCSVVDDWEKRLTTLFVNGDGCGSFWPSDFRAYPEYALYGNHLLPVSEGWIENKGECPVAAGTKIDVLYRDGKIARSVGALDGSSAQVEGGDSGDRAAVEWNHLGLPSDIIAYRLAHRQQPTEDKPELTPCEQRGLKVGQWVWHNNKDVGDILPTGWARLTLDDNSMIPRFRSPLETQPLYARLENIDFTQGIHDSKPDWTPVEWDGEGEPPIGARVEVHGSGAYTVKFGPDASGWFLVESDDGEYWLEQSEDMRQIQSERDKAVDELAKLLASHSDTSHRMRAERLYDAGYRKTENNNES